jgi:hypothetical protein
MGVQKPDNGQGARRNRNRFHRRKASISLKKGTTTPRQPISVPGSPASSSLSYKKIVQKNCTLANGQWQGHDRHAKTSQAWPWTDLRPSRADQWDDAGGTGLTPASAAAIARTSDIRFNDCGTRETSV